jgi:hypothetical protein
MKGKGMEKRTQKRNRCSRWQIYNYVLHLVLDNSAIQGKRKSFRLKNTNPEEYNLSFSEGYRILKDLSEAGIFTRLENHRRRWIMSEWFRERLSQVVFEQRKLIAERLTMAIKDEIVFSIKNDERIKRELLGALGFSETEIVQMRL